MNFTINRNNPKEPENANPYPPHVVNQYVPEQTISKALTELITQTVDPNVLDKIRELDNSNTFISTDNPNANTNIQSHSAIPNAKPLPLNGNPFREKTGLLYRDILHETTNVRKIGDKSNRSIIHK